MQSLLTALDAATKHPAKVQTPSLDVAMSEIAKCVRALAYHRGVIDDANFRDGVNRNAETLISKVIDGTHSFPRRQCVNTETSSQQGHHWFNVAFSVDFKVDGEL